MTIQFAILFGSSNALLFDHIDVCLHRRRRLVRACRLFQTSASFGAFPHTLLISCAMHPIVFAHTDLNACVCARPIVKHALTLRGVLAHSYHLQLCQSILSQPCRSTRPPPKHHINATLFFLAFAEHRRRLQLLSFFILFLLKTVRTVLS